VGSTFNAFLQDCFYIEDNWFVNCRGYSIGTIHHKRSCNILKSFIIQFISLDPRFIISLMLKFMKITKIQKWENKQMNTPYTQMNTICIPGNPIWEKTQLEGEATRLSFLWYRNYSSTKKESLFEDFPLTYGMYGYYRIYHPLLCSQNTTLICFSQLWNKIQWKIMELLLLLMVWYLT